MIDKIFAPLALILLIVFMAVILWNVPRIELIVITVICVGMAVYDFYRHFKGR